MTIAIGTVANRIRKSGNNQKNKPNELTLLKFDPLLRAPIDCRFDYPKKMKKRGMPVKIMKSIIEIANVKYDFKHKIRITIEKNHTWLVAYPRRLLEIW